MIQFNFEVLTLMIALTYSKPTSFFISKDCVILNFTVYHSLSVIFLCGNPNKYFCIKDEVQCPYHDNL